MILEVSTLAVLTMGFALGLKHATDADHVVAVTTFVGEQNSLPRSMWIGFFWGAGHTLSLTIAGLTVIFLKMPISERLASWLELCVAAMLILLGTRVVLRCSRDRLQFHKHAHVHGASPATKPHSHWHLHSRSAAMEEHSGWIHYGLKPLLVGIVHGAAGSAALMLLVLSTIPPTWTAILYVLVFGAGSIAGMLLISLLLAGPLRWARLWSATLFRNIQFASGLLSCGFGIYLAMSILSGL